MKQQTCLLLTHIRLIDANDLRVGLLFCKGVTNRGTADDLVKIIDTFLKEADLKCEDCLGICTDGTQAMAGTWGGLQAPIKRTFPNEQWTHCAIHQEATASKQLSLELDDDRHHCHSKLHQRDLWKSGCFLHCARKWGPITSSFISLQVPMAVTWEGFIEGVRIARWHQSLPGRGVYWTCPQE